MGDASSVKVAIAAETTFGTNPGSGFIYLRMNNEDLRHAQQVVQSGEIDSARQPAGSVRVNTSAQGSLVSEDSLIAPNATPAGFDLLHTGACMSSWSTIIALSSQSIDIGTPSGGTFAVTDAATSGAFTNAVEGQWLKMSQFTQGTVYAHIVTKTDANNLVCEGVVSDGTAVTAEAGQTDIAISASMIRIGATRNSFSIERQFTDLTTPGYGLLLGCLLGSWQWGVTPQGIITQTFNFSGQSHGTTTSSGAGSPTAKWATQRLNAVDHVKQKMEGSFGSVSSYRIAEINFTLDNRPRFDFEVGTSTPQVGISTPTLTGTFNAFMDDVALQQKLEGDTASKLAFRLDDGTYQRIFTFPSIKFTDGGNPAGGNDQSIVQQLSFAAEADANGIAFQIDRFA